MKMKKTDRLVRLYLVTDPMEAKLIENLLTDHDIACTQQDEHRDGFSGVFRIGIVVWEADMERARKVLTRHRQKN